MQIEEFVLTLKHHEQSNDVKIKHTSVKNKTP